MKPAIIRALELLEAQIIAHQPVAVLGLFSGGHDSLTACHIASRHNAFTAAVHINTGTSVDEGQDHELNTLKFVKETAARQHWPLRVYRAKEDAGQDYEQIVSRYGFPGPAAHKFMYIRLKERALRLAIREAKAGYKRTSRVILVSGARTEESDRRKMGHVEVVKREGSWVWLNIIHDWSGLDCGRYLEEERVQRSPVADVLHKSGECLCGAFAKPGEFDELKFFCPKTAARLEAMRGSASRPVWGWGASDRKQWEIALKKIKASRMPLCAGCAVPEESVHAAKG